MARILEPASNFASEPAPATSEASPAENFRTSLLDTVSSEALDAGSLASAPETAVPEKREGEAVEAGAEPFSPVLPEPALSRASAAVSEPELLPPPPRETTANRAPASWRANPAAVRNDLVGLGDTIVAFVRDESSAALSHLQALSAARSPADAIRLQVAEIQRAADATLTCWSDLARRASRLVAPR